MADITPYPVANLPAMLASMGFPSNPFANGGSALTAAPSTGPYAQLLAAQGSQSGSLGIGGADAQIVPQGAVGGSLNNPVYANQQPSGSGASGATPTGFTGFPNYNLAGFPYQNLPQQAAAAFAPQQFTNGSQYGRWNGVNNNAFGLFPNQFAPLFGYQPQGGGMQFQPPYGNNGLLGSNQGPGANPGAAQMPQLPQSPMPKIATDGGAGNAQGANPSYGAYGTGAFGGNWSGGSETPPSLPTNFTPDNTAFASNLNPMSLPANNRTTQALQHAIATGRVHGSMIQQYQNSPQSFTPAQFNAVAGQNPVLAEAMLGQGGQGYINAVAQQNGWNPQQMNSFINAFGQTAQPGFNPQAMQLLNSLGVR